MSLSRLVALVALAAGVACRGSTEPIASSIEQAAFADSLHIDLAKFQRLPSGMYVRDSVEGTGTTLAEGQRVGVRYLEFLPGGRVLQQNVSPASTLSFTLGAGQAIQGWDEGLPGMKVGGKRMLIVPPELAYGAEGRGPVPPGAVLVFLVEALGAAP